MKYVKLFDSRSGKECFVNSSNVAMISIQKPEGMAGEATEIKLSDGTILIVAKTVVETIELFKSHGVLISV